MRNPHAIRGRDLLRPDSTQLHPPDGASVRLPKIESTLMTIAAKPDQDAAKPKLKRSRPMAKMPPQNARRQGAITSLAFLQFGNRDRAVTFLNGHNADLDAKPLDVASDSNEGSSASAT